MTLDHDSRKIFARLERCTDVVNKSFMCGVHAALTTEEKSRRPITHSSDAEDGSATTKSPPRKPACIGTVGSCKRARGVRDALPFTPACSRLSNSRPFNLLFHVVPRGRAVFAVYRKVCINGESYSSQARHSFDRSNM